MRYFLGQNKFNYIVLGWAGHSEDSGTIGTVGEILARVSDNKIEDIFDYVEDIDVPWEHITASNINYPDNCRSLALSSVPELKDKLIRTLHFSIKDLQNYSIKFTLTELLLTAKETSGNTAFKPEVMRSSWKQRT